MISTQPVKLACQKCGKWNDMDMLIGVSISVWAAHVKTWKCPHCGAGWTKQSFTVGDKV